MRTTLGLFAALAAIVSVPLAALQNDEPSPVYLRGFYRLHDRYAVWQYSDRSPWYVQRNAPWADRRFVKWGYVPVMHDSQRYYCLIDRDPPTGTRIAERTFTCGDPATVEELYLSNQRPFGLLYGGPY
ncbi:MAG TPA: hypothetical protein VK803_00195 [Steroidobacteraceae bacterium]|jgi:hypothetical protein|nr:hypothetical protein [Steroidobacteraceae bacterium]